MPSDVTDPQVDVPMASGSDSLNEMAVESSLGEMQGPHLKSDARTVTEGCCMSPDELKRNISEYAKTKSLWDPFCCKRAGSIIAVVALLVFIVSAVIVFTHKGPLWLTYSAIGVAVTSKLLLIFAVAMIVFGLRREANIGKFLKKKANGERVVESEAIQNPFHDLYNEAVGLLARGCRTRSIERDPNMTPERQPQGHGGSLMHEAPERSSRYRFFDFAKRSKGHSSREGSKSESTPLLENSSKHERTA